MPFLGSALGLRAMCSLGWGNLVGFDWNDLLVGREFDCKFLKKVKSPPYALPSPPAGITLIGALALEKVITRKDSGWPGIFACRNPGWKPEKVGQLFRVKCDGKKWSKPIILWFSCNRIIRSLLYLLDRVSSIRKDDREKAKKSFKIKLNVEITVVWLLSP